MITVVGSENKAYVCEPDCGIIQILVRQAKFSGQTTVIVIFYLGYKL